MKKKKSLAAAEVSELKTPSFGYVAALWTRASCPSGRMPSPGGGTSTSLPSRSRSRGRRDSRSCTTPTRGTRTMPSTSRQWPALLARCVALKQACDGVTVVFDKGNNSPENITDLRAGKFHYVASLRPSSYEHLLAMPEGQVG